jgi:NTP pyrophosphatase (non-canonical NTP hydrolase)
MTIDQNTITRAIHTWGAEKQLRMVREECLELALAIGKVLERDDSAEAYTAMQKEIADVNIMIQQANIICGQETIQGFIDQKLARLNVRLDKKEF